MITTTDLLPSPVQQSLSMKMLSVPTPYMIHKIPAMLELMPRNGGKTLRRRRYNPLNTATVPLGNSGVTPPPQTLTAVNIDAEMSFYGTYVYINEQVTLQSQDPVLNQAALRLGVSLKQSEDELARDMLQATASFLNAVEGTNGDNPTNITREDIDTISRVLHGNNAYTISDSIEGDDKYGSAPVRDCYFALGHTNMIGELDNVTGFQPKANYPQQDKVLRPEYCTIGNTRFLLSSIGSISPNASMNGADVYNIFYCGLEAYMCVDQDGYSAQFIYRPPIFDGPLALNCSVGYKFAEVPRITNDAWVINQRVTLNT